MVAGHSASPGALDTTLRAMAWSGLFVAAWGLLEYASFYLNFSFPYTLFNNNPTESVTNVGRVLRGGALELKRITSVAIEPSIFAQIALVILPQMVFAVWSRRPVISRFIDRLTLALLLAALVLSTSATAYAGLAFLSLVIPMVLLAMGKKGTRPLIGGMIVVALLAIGSMRIGVVRTFVTEFVLTKPSSDSGLERLVVTLNAWEYFLQHPLLGLGWGSVPSTDLIVYLLANSGVLGLAVFVLMVTHVFGRLRRALREAHNVPAYPWLAYRIAGIMVAFATILFVSAISRMTYEYKHFWLVLGLAIAAPGAMQSAARSRQLENAPEPPVPVT
jgi:O-antigen ligase